MTDTVEKAAPLAAEAFATIGRFALAWRDAYAARMVTFAREVNERTRPTPPESSAR